MNKEILEKLLEYIDLQILAMSESALRSSDSGLLETMRASFVRDELFDLVKNNSSETDF